jgi:hypothetical protein
MNLLNCHCGWKQFLNSIDKELTKLRHPVPALEETASALREEEAIRMKPPI